MPDQDRKRIRLQLDERRARAVHAALREALNAQLLTGDHADAARDVLEHLDDKVPGWLETSPIGGEAGYLLAAEAVLRALIDAEDAGRRSLNETELLRELGTAKPLGTTADDVLNRLRREKLITVATAHRDEPSFAAAPAGRRFLHRDTAAADDAWRVRDADGLLDLIYAEHRPGPLAHRPSVQAIGRLDDAHFAELVEVLAGLGLLLTQTDTILRDVEDRRQASETTLELAPKGSELARERWKESAPPGVYRSLFDGPPAPPLPFRRRLPLRIDRADRSHPDDGAYCSSYSVGAPAAWLAPSSKTKLFATLKRDGAVHWKCPRCDRTWLVYLQGYTAADEPAYADPTTATHNRPRWRPAFP